VVGATSGEGFLVCASVEISMSVLLIVGSKCTLAASHAVSWLDNADRTDRRTDGRQTVTYALR